MSDSFRPALLVSALLAALSPALCAETTLPVSDTEATTILAKLRDRIGDIEREMTRLDLAALERPARHRLRATLHQLDRHVRRLELEGIAEIRREIARLDRGLVTGTLRPRPPAAAKAEPAAKGAGGGIGGTVTDADTGLPVAGIAIQIMYSTGNHSAAYATTGPSGHYLAGGLAAGEYLVVAFDYSDRYVAESYDNIPCPGGQYSCDLSAATRITLASETVTGGIDFALDLSGSISGTITDSDTGAPISSAGITIWDSAGINIGYDFSNFDGSYRVQGLAAGTYFITVTAYDYSAESYDDLPCPGGPFSGCDPLDGTPVAVTLGTETGNIDFFLRRLGVIKGRVTDATTGLPIVYEGVRVFDASGNSLSTSGFLDGQGRYEIDGLDAGIYFVTTQTYNYADELYDDIPCPGSGFDGGCDPLSGAPIAVSLGDTTSEIDFALIPLGRVSGLVVDAATRLPIRGIEVEAFNSAGYAERSAVTKASGRYTIGGLESSHVFVATTNYAGYLDQLYDGMSCEEGTHGGCDPTLGTPVPVTLGATTSDIDFALTFAGTIAGTVRHGRYGTLLQFVSITIYESNGYVAGAGTTDILGRYRIFGLAPGTYFALASDYQLPDQLYNGIPCTFYCNPATGTPIIVGIGEEITGIDFSLGTLPVFTDGFESADTSAWSDAVPGGP